MASVKFAGLVSDVRGSIGGITFQGGPNGTFVRRLSIPKNRKTDSQCRARLNLAVYAGKWRALTNEDRQEWIDDAASMTFQNRVGETVTLTGFQYFMQANLNLETAAFSI